MTEIDSKMDAAVGGQQLISSRSAGGRIRPILSAPAASRKASRRTARWATREVCVIFRNLGVRRGAEDCAPGVRPPTRNGKIWETPRFGRSGLYKGPAITDLCFDCSRTEERRLPYSTKFLLIASSLAVCDKAS